MKRLVALLGFALFLLMPTPVSAAECQFVLGFMTIRDLIGHDIVGECLENEHYEANGDSLQQTTGGLLAWRKADNWTAFTDGYRTWINGPNGLVQRLNTARFEWEHDYAPGGGIATPTPGPLPTPAPPASVDTLTELTPPSIEAVNRTKAVIRSLAWVQDGISTHGIPRLRNGMEDPKRWEETVVQTLEQFAEKSPELAMNLISKPWLQDGLHRWEFETVSNLNLILFGDPLTALQLSRMPFLDSVDAGDSKILDSIHELRTLPGSSRHAYRQLLANSALRGGITDDLRTTVVYLVSRALDPAIAKYLDTLPWVQDGISPADSASLGRFYGLITADAHRLVQALTQKPWVRDGLDESEQKVLVYLWSITVHAQRQDEDAAVAILQMPFLYSVDAADAAAMQSLAYLHSHSKGSYLRQVLSHPFLSDGIADWNVGLVSVMYLALNSRPKLLDTFLDPQRTSVERRVISMPRAGDVVLSVIFIDPGIVPHHGYLGTHCAYTRRIHAGGVPRQ